MLSRNIGDTYIENDTQYQVVSIDIVTKDNGTTVTVENAVKVS